MIITSGGDAIQAEPRSIAQALAGDAFIYEQLAPAQLNAAQDNTGDLLLGVLGWDWGYD